VIWTHLAAAIVALLIGLFGGWQTQGWRLGEQIAAMKAAQAQAVIAGIEGARAQEQARFKGVQDAATAATKRAQANRADADNARNELDRLRDAIAASRDSVPGDSVAACTARADTARELFLECGAALSRMGRAADAHANDALTLQAAWPK